MGKIVETLKRDDKVGHIFASTILISALILMDIIIRL